ncbi:restriction endonuclease [Promicromonospora soli]
MAALEDLLDDYMFRSESETDRNEKFAALMKAFLRADEEWAAQFDAVWSWDEWPEHEGPCDGIDLVAREHDTENLVAVQCAFHDPSQPLSKPEVAPFLSASNKAPFTGRLVLATTDTWNKDLEEEIQDDEIPVTRIGLKQMLDSSVDWARFRPQTVAAAG